MTDPAITRLAEFTKRLGADGYLSASWEVYADPNRADAALCADLTHVLAELEGARKALEPFVKAWNSTGASLPPNYPHSQIAAIARDLITDEDFRRAAQLRRDEEKEG